MIAKNSYSEWMSKMRVVTYDFAVITSFVGNRMNAIRSANSFSFFRAYDVENANIYKSNREILGERNPTASI